MKNDPRDYVELKKVLALTHAGRHKCQLLSEENYYGNLRNVRMIIEIFFPLNDFSNIFTMIVCVITLVMQKVLPTHDQ